ncbi:MAG: GFA family protein [Sphingomicrobium sp.]
MSETLRGGCSCGRIRYEADIDDYEAYLCHCRMCQRASGNVSLALKNIEQAQVRWSTEPDWYRSSAIAQRPFCASCGTSLGFRYDQGSTKMDLTVASFEEAGRFRPVSHFGAESMHEAWLDTADLPQTRCDDFAALVARWTQSGTTPPQ